MKTYSGANYHELVHEISIQIVISIVENYERLISYMCRLVEQTSWRLTLIKVILNQSCPVLSLESKLTQSIVFYGVT